MLAGNDGKFPALWDFFMPSLDLKDGRGSATEGGYGTGHSLVRLKVPASARGAYKIVVADIAGNETSMGGTVTR
jgi:hypothetical protein